jgi:hypothetical protein
VATDSASVSAEMIKARHAGLLLTGHGAPASVWRGEPRVRQPGEPSRRAPARRLGSSHTPTEPSTKRRQVRLPAFRGRAGEAAACLDSMRPWRVCGIERRSARAAGSGLVGRGFAGCVGCRAGTCSPLS